MISGSSWAHASGAGYTFGGGVVRKFLEINGMKHILRAHQLCMEGYAVSFDNHLTTVWSAPNYCYRAGNSASILEVGPNEGEMYFNVFTEAPENGWDGPYNQQQGQNKVGNSFLITSENLEDDIGLFAATGIFLIGLCTSVFIVIYASHSCVRALLEMAPRVKMMPSVRAKRPVQPSYQLVLLPRSVYVLEWCYE